MRKQFEILKEMDWDVLVIFDCCRYDFYAEEASSDIQAVQVPFRNIIGGAQTAYWVDAFAKEFPEPLVFVSGHPQASRVIDKHMELCAGVQKHLGENYLHIPVWRYRSGEKFPDKPLFRETTHPACVLEEAERYTEKCGQPERLLIWLLPPHTPFVADPEWVLEIEHDPVWKPKNEWTTEDILNNEDWVCRWTQAYRRNVRFGLREFWSHSQFLKGTVCLTSDHGAFLGEPISIGGREHRFIGHGGVPPIGPQIKVPFEVLEKGPAEKTPVNYKYTPDRNVEIDKTRTYEKLRALGYT